MHDLALLAVIGIVSLPNLFWLLPVPLLVLATFRQLLRAVATYAQAQPFTLTLVPIFLGYSGLGISLWPNIVPPSLDFRAAASPPQSQGFMLVGALSIIPFILGYTAWSYYVFRGKRSMPAITEPGRSGAGAPDPPQSRRSDGTRLPWPCPLSRRGWAPKRCQTRSWK